MQEDRRHFIDILLEKGEAYIYPGNEIDYPCTDEYSWKVYLTCSKIKCVFDLVQPVYEDTLKIQVILYKAKKEGMLDMIGRGVETILHMMDRLNQAKVS